MSKVLDKQYLDTHFRGETLAMMTYLLTQGKGNPISTSKIAEDVGIAQGNVASRLCVMRSMGAVSSTINPDNSKQFMWVINATIPTRYRKRRAKVKLRKANWRTSSKEYTNRVVEVAIKSNPEKGKIDVLLELVDTWKVPYVQAVEMLRILTKAE